MMILYMALGIFVAFITILVFDYYSKGKETYKHSDIRVFDKVWVMKNNKPKSMVVVGMADELDSSGMNVKTWFYLANSRMAISKMIPIKQYEKYASNNVFTSKKNCITSLMEE